MSHSHSKVHARGRAAERRALWGWPVALGLLSLAGLLAALVYDGWGDLLSWLLLSMPVAAMLWFGLLRRNGPRS